MFILFYHFIFFVEGNNLRKYSRVRKENFRNSDIEFINITIIIVVKFKYIWPPLESLWIEF